MKTGFLIVNYNDYETTNKLLNNIKNYSCLDMIIVVDNNSTDGSQELLSHDNRIVFIEAGENLGFGKANNLGFKKSTGYICSS